MSAIKNEASLTTTGYLLDAPDEWAKVFKKTRLALGTNLTKVCEVAGTGHDENVEGISNTALHKKTGIARSAIQKFIDGENSKGVSNPDLKTICHLASELNIPPAFLLMSSDDWRRLIVAITTMQDTVQQDAVLCESVLHAIECNKAAAGLELVKRLGTYPDKLELTLDQNIQKSEIDRLMKDIDRRNEIKRQSILAMTAIAQNYSNTVSANSSQKAKKEYLATLTTLAAIFGAGVRTN